MRKTALTVMLLLMTFHTAPIFAADFQARLLLHKQVVFEGRSLGIAGWFVAPDISTTRPLKNLFVAGPCYKDAHSWAEVMLGVMLTSTSQGDTLIKAYEFVGDVRVQCKNMKFFDVFAEFFIRPSDPVMICVITRQVVALHGLPALSAGGEWDWFIEKEIRIGPRLTMSYKTLSITATRQYAEHQNILRLYCLANL